MVHTISDQHIVTMMDWKIYISMIGEHEPTFKRAYLIKISKKKVLKGRPGQRQHNYIKSI